jgi:hypothetical protein
MRSYHRRWAQSTVVYTPPKTCATCKRHSAPDSCCELTGDTRKPTDPACFNHTDGKTDAKPEGEART